MQLFAHPEIVVPLWFAFVVVLLLVARAVELRSNR